MVEECVKLLIEQFIDSLILFLDFEEFDFFWMLRGWLYLWLYFNLFLIEI